MKHTESHFVPEIARSIDAASRFSERAAAVHRQEPARRHYDGHNPARRRDWLLQVARLAKEAQEHLQAITPDLERLREVDSRTSLSAEDERMFCELRRLTAILRDNARQAARTQVELAENGPPELLILKCDLQEAIAILENVGAGQRTAPPIEKARAQLAAGLADLLDAQQKQTWAALERFALPWEAQRNKNAVREGLPGREIKI